MTDYMAAMLDELMGPTRNAGLGDKASFDFDHPDVCKDFLVGFCPNELFRNTKADMGFCNLFHDPGLKKKYEDSSRRYRLGYEENFLEKIGRLDFEVRRKIEKNEKRLNLTQGASEDEGFLKLREKTDERKAELSKLISLKMDEAEKAGSDGNVALAQTLIAEADALSKERESCEDEGRALVERAAHLEEVANQLNKPMTVCQTCGCFMLVNDAQSRIDDHFAGKMHVAFARIRETIEQMKKEMDERKKSASSSRGERGAEKERSGGDRDKERERDRRDGGGRDRDRDRDRERRRSRSPRRDRDRGDRRDDRRSDRSERDRERDRDRDRRSRR